MPENALKNWQELAAKFMKGAPLEKLARHNADGIALGPLFTVSDNPQAAGNRGELPFTRGGAHIDFSGKPWDVVQPVRTPEPDTANCHLLQELQGGATGILLHLGDTGIKVETKKDLALLLDGFHAEMASIGLSPNADNARYAGYLFDLWADQDMDLTKVSGSLGLSGASEEVMALAAKCRDEAPRMRAMVIDAARIHEQGGSEALELGVMLAEGLAVMKSLMLGCFSATDAANQIHASYAMPANVHMGIAKLRAARSLWSRMTNMLGADAAACELLIHARTSQRMLSKVDSWTNILRNASAAFAAIAGGAQAISVEAFTLPLGQPDDLARRLARNTQLVLAEECALGRVADPVGGAHLHERLTEDLVQEAWTLFQEIETQGGLAAAIQDGWLDGKLENNREAVQKAIRTRESVLVGVNSFADLNETPPKLAGPWSEHETANFREAEEFETLRHRADHGSFKPVFLASIGTLAQSSVRTNFARDFLACGGLITEGGIAWDNRDALLDDFGQSGAHMAMICGTDAAYEQELDGLAAELIAAGAQAVWVAGQLNQTPDSLFNETIWQGCDMVEKLTIAQAISGGHA